jgi:anti-sigma B factor antagonist
MEKIHKEVLGMMGKIDIDCRDEQGIIIIDLRGQLDVYNSAELQKLVNAYTSRDLLMFVLNLANVSYLDSSTISIFLYCLQMLEKAGGKFSLAGLTGAPLEVFEMSKLHEVFDLHPDVSSAIKSQTT